MKPTIAPLRDPRIAAVVAVLVLTVMVNLSLLVESLARSCVPVALGYVAYTMYGKSKKEEAIAAAGGALLAFVVLF